MTSRFASPLRLLAFGVLSIALHAAAWRAVLRRGGAAEPPSFDPTSQTLAGETLDIESASPPPSEDESSEPTPATPSRTKDSTQGASRSMARFRGVSGLARPAAGEGKALAAPPVLFGAVGVRFATDLPTTFTRALSQAVSADPGWSAAPFGVGGRADVTLALDEEGHLSNHTIVGSPSLALRSSVERTIVLLAPRSFTARRALTKLRVRAYVSRDDVHDGLHGDVFALSAGSFSGEVGTAFVALPASVGAGRRVDIEVRLIP